MLSHIVVLPTLSVVNVVLLTTGTGLLYCTYLMSQMLWGWQRFSFDGIRVGGRKTEFIPWADITCWRQETETSFIQIELKDGRQRYLNNIGPKRHNAEIAVYVAQHLGPKSSAKG